MADMESATCMANTIYNKCSTEEQNSQKWAWHMRLAQLMIQMLQPCGAICASSDHIPLTLLLLRCCCHAEVSGLTATPKPVSPLVMGHV